jgi:hypothetical protein
MKRSKLKFLAALAVGVALGRGAQADTIITFDTLPGSLNNSPLAPDFGDNVGTSKPGIDVVGFGTAGIALNFQGSGGATRWEYYIDGVWSAAQLNGSTIGSFHSIDFTPGPTAAVAIKSFNFHPYYVSDETYDYAWSVRAGATVLASGTISFQADATKNHSVVVDYNGNLGQALTLRLDRTGGSGSGQNIAVDDIRFGQLPEPAGPYVLSSAPVPGQNPTRPDAPFDATITNGVTQLAPGSIRLFLNGEMVTPVVTPLAESATVSYAPPALLPSGSSNKYSLVYGDNALPPRSYTNEVPFVVAPYVNIQLPAPLYLETFDGLAEGSLPAGWTAQNVTSPITPGLDPNDVTSDFYLNWAVVNRSTISNLANVTASYLSVFNVLPFQVVNSQVVTSLTDGNLVLSASEGRPAGAQIRYLFTGDYNLSGRSDISISFHSLWTQNQDSFGSVEYSINGGATWLPALYLLDGPDILRDGTGQIDASNSLAAVYGDVADPVTMLPQNGYYGSVVGVARERWATLGPYFSARVNDDTTESKRVEVLRLPQADNQPAVRFRFAHSGSDSWYFGIDNFGIYSGAIVPPLLSAVTPASRVSYVGSTATFTASARGAVPIGYQWRKNEVILPGQTGATLSLQNLQLGDAGNYAVVVTSSGLSVTSSPVSLSVLSTPSCGVTEDLMVYLNFDNNLNGQGGTTVSGTLMTGVARYAPGVIGQAASFQNDARGGGPSDWAVTLGNQDAIYAGNFTVALWLKTSITSDGALTGNKDWNSGGNTGWLMDQYDVGYLNFRAAGGDRYDLGPEIRDGVWHHLALSVHRETNGFILYLDGAPVDTGRIGPTGAEALGSGFDTLIGASGPGAYAGTGDIDEYAIWTRALPSEEVACVFANALNGKTVDQLPSDPRLHFSLGSFGELTISWGSVFTGYTLECSPTLGSGAVWNAVPGVVNNSVVIVIFPDAASKFYRLSKP